MKVKDLDKVAAIEKAIAKKFGTDTVVNPKMFWTAEKEKEYLEQVKEFYREEKKKEEQFDKVEKDGFFLPKNLITKKSKRKCPVCDVYSFDMRDDLYMNKFECCFKCYIVYVEDQEERWETGWRPDKEQN